ncbi:MAG TPA: DUF3987 domain-containing protein [Prolixibacteraceae bacterium]|jgi:hypothetical protein
MSKKFNSNQGSKSNSHEPEPSSEPTVKYTQHLLEISYPENLMDYLKATAPRVPMTVALPALPDLLFTTLPDFLKKSVARSTSREERDILLLGTMVTLSACFSKIYGYYDNFKIYPNLYLFVAGKPAAGKGRLLLCRHLVDPIHDALREQTMEMKRRYVLDMKKFNLSKSKGSVEKPVMPFEKRLFIPAINRSSDVFQLLADNAGIGLIFETEGDLMAEVLKSKYAHYNDGLRKGFEHEMISYFRVTNHKYTEIKFPRFSVVMAGTINHLTNLIPCAENGLFSRYMFYFMNIKSEWKNVFYHGRHSLDDYFRELGQEFLPFYTELDKHPDMSFQFTKDQKQQFHSFFTQLQDRYEILQDMEFLPTIQRLGLIAFRLAMILTTLRIMDTGDFSQEKKCLDVDFQASLSMVGVLVRHASHVYSLLPEE